MTAELKVHPSFFREFATKTWVSPHEIVKELIENAFDEDATEVIVTSLKDGSLVIEDNAGMDQKSMEKFLLLGSPHKTHDPISPKLKRIRTGRYGTGRLSFLTSFEKMKIRTRRDEFNLSLVIDGNTLDNLFSGNASLEMLKELPLSRNGTELSLIGSKLAMDNFRLSKEIRKLAILRQPMFEVYIKSADNFVEWDFNNAQLIKAPDIQGHRIPVDLDNGWIVGEMVIARRPLSEDEKGIAVMVGNHVVTRSNFGFDTKFNRVTGYVRCDTLTSRFADKSALIEDEEYAKFNKQMKTFIIDVVIPGLTQYEDVLITREESKIYKEIDKVLGQAIIDNIESREEVQGYEMVDIKEAADVGSEVAEASNLKKDKEMTSHGPTASNQENNGNNNILTSPEQKKSFDEIDSSHQDLQKSEPMMLNYSQLQQQQQTIPKESLLPMTDSRAQHGLQKVEGLDPANKEQRDRTMIKVRKPIIKKTFALKKIGYKVIPYEDESDSRYSFTNENVVFVNKANSTYRAEASRGDEFLLRHIIGIVAEVIAETKHPEGKDALEFLNRLVSEAIRIHDDSVIKK
ncbi:MAG: ATP-binding protein [Nitrososphaeraceae archaeon]|nr:ATP-binding protein [Nitrososphaeraceae archaeon]